MKFLYFVAFSTVFLTFVAFSFQLEDCGSELGHLDNITITGCPNLNDVRCLLHRQTNVTITIVFSLKSNVENVKSVVYGVVLGVEVPFSLPNPDGCNNSGLTCPLTTQGPYTYFSTLPVLKKYPRVTVDVKWELVNEENKKIICVIIPSKIV